MALYLLPQARRHDALCFYHFCRCLDEQIDGSSLSLLEKKNLLESYEEALLHPDSSCLLSDIHRVIEGYQIDRKLFCSLLAGMRMDLELHRYQNFEDLRPYLWRVACTVGLISSAIFGARGETATNYSEHLGMALQLTNILRDVAEDAARDRIYLPLEDLQRFYVTEEELLQGIPSAKAIHLFDYQAERALSYFAKAELAWQKIAPQTRHLLRPARLMQAIYRALLEEMRRDRYELFHRRYHVGLFKKIGLALQLMVSDHH